MIGLSNSCKWVFNEAFLTLWCHVVVDFEMKMSHFSATFQEGRAESLGRSPVCHIGVSDEGRSSSTGFHRLLPLGCQMIANGVFNEASLMPWCHAVVHFVVKMSRFSTKIKMIANGCSLTLWCLAVVHLEVKKGFS